MDTELVYVGMACKRRWVQHCRCVFGKGYRKQGDYISYGDRLLIFLAVMYNESSISCWRKLSVQQYAPYYILK